MELIKKNLDTYLRTKVCKSSSFAKQLRIFFLVRLFYFYFLFERGFFFARKFVRVESHNSEATAALVRHHLFLYLSLSNLLCTHLCDLLLKIELLQYN